MADKTKKKPSFFTLRRGNSQSLKNEEGPKMTPSGTAKGDVPHFRSMVARATSSDAKPRK